MRYAAGTGVGVERSRSEIEKEWLRADIECVLAGRVGRLWLVPWGA
jgi:hypothetical protein